MRPEAPREPGEPRQEHVASRFADPFRRGRARKVPLLVLLVEALELLVPLRKLPDRHQPADLEPEVERSQLARPRSAGRHPKRAFQRIGSKTNDERTYRKSSFEISKRPWIWFILRIARLPLGAVVARLDDRREDQISVVVAFLRPGRELTGRVEERGDRGRRRRFGTGPAPTRASCPTGTRSRCRAGRCVRGRTPGRAPGSHVASVIRPLE